jgi:nucleoside-diphosphate-sugar epimerase
VTSFSNERIYSIGWQARYDLKDGVAETYPWIEKRVKAAQARGIDIGGGK